MGNFNIEQILTLPRQRDGVPQELSDRHAGLFCQFHHPHPAANPVMGYTARIMRQVVNGEELHMPAWDDWESILKDGLYLFGVRIVTPSPCSSSFLPLFFGMMFLPIWLNSQTTHAHDPSLPVLRHDDAFHLPHFAGARHHPPRRRGPHHIEN